MTKPAPSLTGLQTDLVRAYRNAGGDGYDELLDADGDPRSHWRALLEGLGELTGTERAQRAMRVDPAERYPSVVAMREELVAFVRQADAASGPVKERHAQLFFQLPDLGTDRCAGVGRLGTCRDPGG